MNRNRNAIMNQDNGNVNYETAHDSGPDEASALDSRRPKRRTQLNLVSVETLAADESLRPPGLIEMQANPLVPANVYKLETDEVRLCYGDAGAIEAGKPEQRGASGGAQRGEQRTLRSPTKLSLSMVLSPIKTNGEQEGQEDCDQTLDGKQATDRDHQ